MKTGHLRTSLVLAVALVAAGLLLAFAVRSAHAAFRGTNGKIAFYSGRSIYTINPNGTGKVQLPEDAIGFGGMSVSSNGTRIAYSAGHNIYLMNADGSGLRQLTDYATSAYSDHPSFSPDGKKIAFERGFDIWVMNSDGTGQKDLTNTPNDQWHVQEYGPAWSPTGGKIAYTASGCNHGGGSCVYVMNADGSNQTNISTQDSGTCGASLLGSSSQPDWSPDGTKLTVTGPPVCGNSLGTDIWVMNADGSGQTDLIQDNATGDNSPVFSPDGAKIAFTRGSHLYTMSASGGGITQVKTGLYAEEGPNWGVAPRQQGTSLSLSTSPLTLTYGQNTVLSGRLVPANGGLYAGQRVMIQKRPAGATSFSNLKAVSTNYNGAFRLSLKPLKNTYYRAVYTGNNTLKLGTSASAAKLVRVKVRTTENVSTTSVTLGKSLVISGAVSPSHNGYVKLIIRRNGSLLTTKNAPLGSSRYRFVYKPPQPGGYSVVASYAKDTDHLGNVSPAKIFKVVR